MSPILSTDYPASPNLNETPRHAICWASILGGVFVALAATAVLTILGSGLGFAIKPLNGDGGPSLKTLSVVSVIWMILVQWVSLSLGGYITGRLRTRWVNVHAHEVFFRDTAHGFITWATATVLMMGLLASIASATGHIGARMAAAHPLHNMHSYTGGRTGGTLPSSEASGGPLAYYTDILFRAPAPAANGAPASAVAPIDDATRAEANRILVHGLKDASWTEEDKAYLSQMVSTRTGLSDADARHRVDDVTTRLNSDEMQMREITDNARKSAATLSICIALSLLIGAFVASISAALGGNIRDRHN